MGAEDRKQERTTEYIRRDPIGEYSPLPVFASDQIGGWFVVDSSEYIPRSLSRPFARDARGVTNGRPWKRHGRYFVFLLRPLWFLRLGFLCRETRCNKRFATMFAYKELSASL